MPHLSQEQRYAIYAYLQAGHSVSEIAACLGKCKSVIYRELMRNSQDGHHYDWQVAQEKYERRQLAKRKHTRLTDSMKDYIRRYIREDYSPEQIVGRARLEGVEIVSVPTIYKFLREEGGYSKHLRQIRYREQRRYSKKSGMGVIPDRVMIGERPAVINNRERFGDFEADTMWIADKACFLTVTERSSGLSFLRLIPDRKSDTVKAAFRSVFRDYQGEVHSITVDNGKEFYHHRELSEMLKVDFYFANPYRSGERGTNENTNGLYRQYLPRRTKKESLSIEYIRLIETKINNRPRKRLGFLSPTEVFIAKFGKHPVAFTN